MKKYIYRLLAGEISKFSRFYDALYQVEPRTNDAGILFDDIVCPRKGKIRGTDDWPRPEGEEKSKRLYLLNGNPNYSQDVQKMFTNVWNRMRRGDRLVVVLYSAYLGWLYKFLNVLKIRKGDVGYTFLTVNALSNLARLSDFEILKMQPAVYVPFSLLGLGTLLNRCIALVPVVKWLSFACLAVLRKAGPEAPKPSLSIVIPARNEKGNIENALRRLPLFRGADVEVIFVEGNSTDGTWEEINRVARAHRGKRSVVCLQQDGKGKNDAVRKGFAAATKDLLTVLDADLTMPPEMLERYYDAYAEGKADFINGNRLVYPMENKAMRFLNRVANVLFAELLGWILGIPIGDTLCGTKMFARRDYERMAHCRDYIGDLDPFGDFDMLFCASILQLGVIDVPIAYKAREYGSTNIQRFVDGLKLFRMVFVGFVKIKAGFCMQRPARCKGPV